MTLSYAEIFRFALKSDLLLTSFSQSVCSGMLPLFCRYTNDPKQPSQDLNL